VKGAGYLVDLTAGYLEQAVPVMLDRVDRAQTVPRPKLYSTVDQPRLEGDEWPAVLVVGQNLLRQKRIDVTGEGSVYLRTYRIRVYLFARGSSFEQTSRTRYALVLAAVEALMADQTLGDPNVTVDEDSIRESYSDVDTPPKSRRSIAAAFIECDATIQEVRTVPDLGEADLITVELHPALQ
jgi:hypothetical protein